MSAEQYTFRTDYPEDFRAGFLSFVGRPNVGKSTLTNALVGEKVAITSSKPQTTRHTIRGIMHLPQAQVVLVDTPGLHRPRTLLGQRLNDLVAETLADVDVIAFCIPANEKIGPGDRFIAEHLANLTKAPVVAVVTKIDTVKKAVVAEQLLAVHALGEEILADRGGFSTIVPVSSITAEQLGELTDVIVEHLPVSPPLYPEGEISDESQTKLIAEIIREAALEGVREELPHSLAVVVDEIVPREDRPEDKPLTDVRVHLFVERSSQKGIIIGKGGSRLKEIGSRARPQIKQILGVPIYLDLHVKIAKDWQRDPKQLDRLGF